MNCRPQARATTAVHALALGCMFAIAPAARAADQSLLDLLTSKGVITEGEAAAAARAGAATVVVAPRQATTQRLKFQGQLQVEYNYVAMDDQAAGVPNPPATSRFLIRRARFDILADLGNGWGAELTIDFAYGPRISSPPQGVPTSNRFTKAIIAKEVPGYGLGAVGLQKVQFILEENTSSADLKTTDRSVATRYFANPYRGPTAGNLGFAAQHMGVFWFGRAGENGWTYGAALTNGIQSVTAFSTPRPSGAAFNRFAWWGNVAYSGTTTGGLGYGAGLNLGYSADANSTPDQSNAIWGYNPWVKLDYRGFELTGEFMQASVENGRGPAGDTSTAWPLGINFTPSYRLTQNWELVSRFSYLSTNGRGVVPSQAVRGAPNPAAGRVFDDVWSLYAGVNYFMLGGNLRITMGAEFFRFTGRTLPGAQPFSGPPANVTALRTAVQLLF